MTKSVALSVAFAGLLFAAPSFAQSQNGCTTANTTTTTDTTTFLGNSSNVAGTGQGGRGTSTDTITTTQAAPQKCPPAVQTTTTDQPGNR
jgi:hypothetical protein